MRVMPQNHIAEDVLERYVMAKLSEAEVIPVEEHLLVCERCRQRAEGLDEFVDAIRSAATSRRAGAGRPA